MAVVYCPFGGLMCCSRLYCLLQKDYSVCRCIWWCLCDQLCEFDGFFIMLWIGSLYNICMYMQLYVSHSKSTYLLSPMAPHLRHEHPRQIQDKRFRTKSGACNETLQLYMVHETGFALPFRHFVDPRARKHEIDKHKAQDQSARTKSYQ